VSRGHDRERAVKRLLQQEDWWVARAAGSLGDADLVALRKGNCPRLIEVKSSSKERGPYADFGPDEREHLKWAADLAGGAAWLAWWPPRGQLVWFHSSEWPEPRRRRGADDVAA
jgi:Holliday junction resolvase